ncbi:MAG: hypothetical protein J7L26_07545 [Candidatus Aminicenantes bacterium]|nr:hypothetical protein [Candidatus Aminicenantes bacterium]
MDFLMDVLWNKEKKTFQAVKRAAWSFLGLSGTGREPSLEVIAEVVSMVVWGVSYREAPQVLRDEVHFCAPVVKVFPRKIILETVSGRTIRVLINQKRNGEKILLNAPKGTVVVEFLAPRGSFALFCQIHKVLKEAPLYGILVSGTLLYSRRTSNIVDEVLMSPLGRHLKNRDGISQGREVAWQWYYNT